LPKTLGAGKKEGGSQKKTEGREEIDISLTAITSIKRKEQGGIRTFLTGAARGGLRKISCLRL